MMYGNFSERELDAFWIGTETEQTRIIKLLTDFDNEQYLSLMDNLDAEWSKDYWETAAGIRLAIALIKGKNQ